MATVNISLEVPAASGWNTDELVERVRQYAQRLLASVPAFCVKSSNTYQPSEDAVRFLSSITSAVQLPADYDEREDYRKHIEEKYA